MVQPTRDGRRRCSWKLSNQKTYISINSGDSIWVRKTTTIFNIKIQIIKLIKTRLKIQLKVYKKNNKIHTIKTNKKTDLVKKEKRRVHIKNKIIFLDISIFMKAILTNWKKKRFYQRNHPRRILLTIHLTYWIMIFKIRFKKLKFFHKIVFRKTFAVKQMKIKVKEISAINIETKDMLLQLLYKTDYSNKMIRLKLEMNMLTAHSVVNQLQVKLHWTRSFMEIHIELTQLGCLKT